MKKILMIFTIGLVFTITSCHDDDVVQVPQEQIVTKETSSKATLAWSPFVSTNWTVAGTSSTGWYKCHDAMGTNQSSKRAVFTVNNYSSSAGSVYVTMQATTSACPNNSSNQVESFTVNPGYGITKYIDITGYASDLTQLRVKVQPSIYGSGASGYVTYGYEY